MKEKKSIMGQVISVFVLILVIAIFAGLTFLFVAQLKTQVMTTTDTGATSTNETTGGLNNTGYILKNSTLVGFNGLSITAVWTTSPTGVFNISVPAANYTVSDSGVIKNNTVTTYTNATVSYTYNYITSDMQNSFNTVNSTEAAGVTTIGYLPLIFLALIFGALLTLVLKIILPYINLGNQVNQF